MVLAGGWEEWGSNTMGSEDQLEKTKMSVTRYAKWYEVYQPFAIAAVLILLLEILLRLTVFRRIP